MMVIGIDLIAAYQLVKEHFEWKEIAPLAVDRDWLDLAMEKGAIERNREYRWSDPGKAESRRLAETHEFVWLINKKDRTRQKVTRDDAVLIVKNQGSA